MSSPRRSILADLAAALAEKGHEVTVVTGRRAYDHPEKLFPARETWRGVRIIRVSSTRFGKTGQMAARGGFCQLHCELLRPAAVSAAA